MKKYFLFVIVSLIAGLVGFVFGEEVRFASSQVSFNEPVPVGFGAIQGTVTEGLGTLVNFYPPPLSSEIVLLADASGTTILQAVVADNQGRFRFLVQSGQYLVGLGRTGQPIKYFKKVDMDNPGIKNMSVMAQNP